MPLTTDTQRALASLEYRRDPAFKQLTDGFLANLRAQGLIAPHVQVEEALGLVLDGIGLIGLALLDLYHSRLPTGQWHRLRELGAL